MIIKEAQRIMGNRQETNCLLSANTEEHITRRAVYQLKRAFYIPLRIPRLSVQEIYRQSFSMSFFTEIRTKIFVVYTDYGGGLHTKTCSARLLPFHRASFITQSNEKAVTKPFEFTPSVNKILDTIVPSYVTGYIYSALVDSFCSEQNARMEAMDSAGQNAQKLLDELSLQYNHMRQSAITQEITEISAGAKAQKLKQLKAKEMQT